MVAAMVSTSSKRALQTRFKVGDHVRVSKRKSLGHHRTPIYVRGKTAVITEIQGLFHNPSQLAYHYPGLPMMVWYKLRFRQTDLWPRYKGDPGDHLELDLQEDWLELAKDKSR
jgi:nitrile hydratase subunit beta